MGTIAWKILGTGGPILAGILATKVVNLVWAKTGQDEINPKNPDAPVVKALAYAAAMGLAVGAARTLAERKAAEYYRHSAGHLPKDIKAEPV
ncbi:DUF4235 domain-containing protein [Phycicoccus endophyticus]|uniref:DUF4235 domain-containing protein n=1 Tax=Phycicoccus endophyticus TaxID=1690220 RepID=A0A7G9R0A7_9MICO|nr:DUF4235 domain-containing protein [Phycicoccus endophyticus]NHI20161.1 DUF4235 domain-containing protein [Phycicoccus endophyticus]QNN49032.1 DUF4235 domain-containing protein [Phycicoccus endophyticus]GGL37913.1 hypothetical protein GCM10012283_20620 [Phycicoccus endophyticus]